jgi:predicted outer membrane protein
LAAADSMDAQHVLLRNQLLGLSGRTFDSVYIHTRVQDYQQATKLFFQEVITGESSQLKDYSASVLAQLEVYLHQADSLVAKY